MGNFSADWLTIREAADAAARSRRLALAVASRLGHHDVVRAVDLATGTGSNIRYLFDSLPDRQRWLAVDSDSVLLAELPAQMYAWGVKRGYDVTHHDGEVAISRGECSCRVAIRSTDLACLDALAVVDDCDFVTASALMDLVSDQWIRALVARCRAGGAALLFPLIYDGQSRCEPEEPYDNRVRQLVNEHQRTDKGFGAALGPHAGGVAARYLADAGYDVRHEASDWVLASESRELQRELIDGWAAAALHVAPEESAAIAKWHARRQDHVNCGRSRLIVGHVDVGGWLARR